jgi:Uma2 family endonuclease
MNNIINAVAESQTIPISPIVRKRFRVDEFQKMVKAGILPEESGWEVIDGYLVDKMTIGSRHASITKRLNRILTRLLSEKTIISVQDPVQLDAYNEPEPDIAVLKLRDDFYSASHPTPNDALLLIEVSDTTIEYDRETKKNLYARFEIQELWIVNLSENTVEAYSQPKNGSYRLVRILESGEIVKSSSIENLEMSVKEILGL